MYRYRPKGPGKAQWNIAFVYVVDDGWEVCCFMTWLIVTCRWCDLTGSCCCCCYVLSLSAHGWYSSQTGRCRCQLLLLLFWLGGRWEYPTFGPVPQKLLQFSSSLWTEFKLCVAQIILCLPLILSTLKLR
jgi:hypothetical protein